MVIDTEAAESSEEPAASPAAAGDGPLTSAPAVDPAQTPPGAAAPAAAPVEYAAINQIRLVGVVADAGEERELAGGIHVIRWSLRVPRGGGRGGSDLIDCVAYAQPLQSLALQWRVGTVVSVEGALRRRFFRSGGRTATRVEVEAQSAEVLQGLSQPVARNDDPPPSAPERSPAAAGAPNLDGTDPAASPSLQEPRRRRGLLRRVAG